MANKNRIEILTWLKDPEKYFPPQTCEFADKDEVCVGLIEQKLSIFQSTTSKYLSQLCHAGFIDGLRKGQ